MKGGPAAGMQGWTDGMCTSVRLFSDEEEILARLSNECGNKFCGMRQWESQMMGW